MVRKDEQTPLVLITKIRTHSAMCLVPQTSKSEKSGILVPVGVAPPILLQPRVHGEGFSVVFTLRNQEKNRASRENPVKSL